MTQSLRTAGGKTQDLINVGLICGLAAGVAGLVDPAPFFGVWFGLLAIPLYRHRNWVPEETSHV
ncbi:MAG: hypothetical protein JNM76_08570 [Betaproteobacteria bacterium]|nr:hypothetical protein [Betaproteobacteria bacterium]